MVKANKIYYEISQERDRQVDTQERIRLLSRRDFTYKPLNN